MATRVANGICDKSDKTSEVGNSQLSLNCTELKTCINEISNTENNCIQNKLSYWKGPTNDPLTEQTIGQSLEIAAKKYAERIAISFFQGQKLTFSEVLEKVDTLAAAYLVLGLKRGDHIAIWGFNTVEWYLSFLAAFRAGLVAVNINPHYEVPELLPCLNIGDVKAIVMDEKLNDRVFYNILKSAIPEIENYAPNSHITSKHSPLLKTVIIISEQPYNGAFLWKDLFALPNNKQIQEIKETYASINAFDICNIQFTSGTTSAPKGVLLTHHNLDNNAHTVAKNSLLYEKHQKICLQVPFFHTYGAVAGIISSIKSGSTLVLPHVKFSPSKSIEALIAEKCTVVYGTPTMYTDLLTVAYKKQAEDPEIFSKMSTVERFYAGGSVCLPEIIQQLKTNFKNSEFTIGYGMTETSPTTFMSMPDDPEEVVYTSVGQVLDHVEVKVVDKDNKIVPIGTSGEMCFRGYMVMKGYYKDPEKTRAVLSEDGWFRSGDRFVLMENGYAQIVGRIKETIIRGGENIEPKEVEEVIIKYPDVIDVQVYGVFNDRLGEVVAAGVVKVENSKITEDDIKKYCQGKMAPYKIPQYVIFMKEFPKTASGKIKKIELREITEKQLNLI